MPAPHHSNACYDAWFNTELCIFLNLVIVLPCTLPAQGGLQHKNPSYIAGLNTAEVRRRRRGSGLDAVSRLRAVGNKQRHRASVDPHETNQLQRVGVGGRRKRRSGERFDALGLLRANVEEWCRSSLVIHDRQISHSTNACAQPFYRHYIGQPCRLVGRQEGHPGGWWRWALVSPDGVAPSRMVGVSASVNLPLHHKVQKFSFGTGSPGWSRRKGHKMVVMWWCGIQVNHDVQSLLLPYVLRFVRLWVCSCTILRCRDAVTAPHLQYHP